MQSSHTNIYDNLRGLTIPSCISILILCVHGFCSVGVVGYGDGQDGAGYLQRGEEHVLGVHVAVRGLVAEVGGGQAEWRCPHYGCGQNGAGLFLPGGDPRYLKLQSLSKTSAA